MSHKGTVWPVLFRRDWNLNVNNNNEGFANRYLVQLKTAQTGFGTITKAYQFECGPATFTLPNIMQWSSPFITFGPFQFKLQLQSIILGTGRGYQNGAVYTEVHFGTIARWHWDFVGTPYPIFDNQTGAGGTDLWVPSWFDGDPQYYNDIPQKKRWADGPPH